MEKVSFLGLELETYCVGSRRDNHYATKPLSFEQFSVIYNHLVCVSNTEQFPRSISVDSARAETARSRG